MSERHPTPISRVQWVGFFALCLLGASGWLIDSALPNTLPSAQSRALHDLVLGLAGCALGWRYISSGGLRRKPWLKFAAASICLLGLPAALADVVRGEVSQVTVAASFALLPVAVVLLVPHLPVPHLPDARRSDVGTSRLLTPTLIGLAGAMLLLPFAVPMTGRQAALELLVVIAVVVAATASVWMYSLLASFSTIAAIAIFCTANALFSGGLLLASTPIAKQTWSGTWSGLGVETAKAVLFDLPQIVLLVWLMRDVAPARLAARTLVVPLLTVVEGYALLRPEITARSLAAVGLLVLGVCWLMTARETEEGPRLMLR